MSELPDEVERFLVAHVGSVMQLEVLLALRAQGAAMSSRQLMRAIGGSVDQVLRCMLDLERSGLATVFDDGAEVTATYAATGDVERTVAAVADEYGRRRTRVITFVLQDRDPGVLDSFSRAFKLRKDR